MDPETVFDTDVDRSVADVTVTVQEYAAPLVSLVTAKPLQPVSLQNASPSGIDHEKDTLTSPVNQPSQPASPAGVQTTDTLGGSRAVERAAAAGTRTRQAAEPAMTRAA
jgi:hypothetical protein